MADYAIHDTTLIGISNVIRKKEGSSALIDPSEYAERVNLMGMLEEKTASSATVCSFSDGSDDVPMSSVIAHIAPTLTGTNAVNMVQTRKNLVVLSDDYYYDSQRCSYIYENGGISVTASGTYARVGFLFTLKAGIPYTISFNASTSGDYGHFYLSESAPFSGQFANITLSGTETSYTRTFTLNGTSLYIGVYVTATGTTGDTIIKNIQLEVGSTATAYEPYREPTEYTANLGRTIYGGQADIVNGIGTDENGDDFTFDGQEIPSLLGVNNLWHDAGETEAVYRSSGTVTPVVPTLISKTITENGTYSAEDDNADGYDEVTVNVEGDEDMNYSTTEHEVGTWIDGSSIYERTFELQSQLTVSSSTWTSSGVSADGISKIMGVELFGVSNYQGGGLANIQNDVIMLQTTRNSDAYVKEFSLRYTKASASLLSMSPAPVSQEESEEEEDEQNESV